MIILDTNVVSETLHPKPAESLVGWLNKQPLDTLYLSSVCWAELLFGIDALPAGKKRDRLTEASDRVKALFLGRILPFDEEAARHYARLAATAKSSGRPLAVADGFIAAIASARGFTVATRNTKDFSMTDVKLINPWNEQP